MFACVECHEAKNARGEICESDLGKCERGVSLGAALMLTFSLASDR